MKNLILVLLAMVLLNACKKNKNEPLYNYKMTKYDVQVTPTERKVSILFQVLDKEGIGVDKLTEPNFNIYENNEIISSEAGVQIDPSKIPSTIRTVLLLDISSSVSDFMDQLKEASIALINSQLNDQEFAIFTFDKDIEFVQDFTSDKSLLISKINQIPETDLVSSTNLYGALIDVTADTYFEWIEYYTIDEIYETNIVLFTDGKHNADPSITLNMALSSIDGRKVYVAALQSDDLKEDALKQIATEYVLAENTDQIKTKFEEVQGKIEKLSNSLYYLYYTSPITNPASRENDLEIKIKDNAEGASNSIKTKFNSLGFN
ncbi:MAG: hypothetical protein B6I20_02245 [Bacteroidetes bacterium 4572_117]|nr:MAG: hypothetical protein B6I20_02245 [Bacteroidetes bacterium 4572_117]